MPTAYQDQAWLRVLGHAVTGPLGSPLPRLPLRVPADWPGGVGHEGDASLGERGVPELCRVAPPEASENRTAACWQLSRARSTIFMRSACPACSVQQSGQAGGVHGAGLTATPTPAVGRRLRGAVGGRGSA
jgi:hypothetical protein